MLEQIKAGFKTYFEPFGEIELPENIPQKGSIDQGRKGWNILYVLNEDEQGNPCLDFLAKHPATSMFHGRINSDGSHVSLESYLDSYTFDPDVEGDQERARQEFEEHNRKVDQILKAKGF